MDSAQFESKRQELIRFIKAHSYKEGDFTLVSGKKSKFYVDMKHTTLHPEGAKLLGQLMAFRLRQIGVPIKGVGGMTLGADPIATAVSMAAYEMGETWPAFIVRKQPKPHGISRWVEGAENLQAYDTVVVLEDVVTTGGSSVLAAERLMESRLQPNVVLTIVDREAGARELCENAGLRFEALMTLKEIQSA